jgi:hypothetical protein
MSYSHQFHQNFRLKRKYLIVSETFLVRHLLTLPSPSVGRAVAGAGASALFSGGNFFYCSPDSISDFIGMTIIGFTVPLKKRPMFIAAISSMFGIASVVGPLLGKASPRLLLISLEAGCPTAILRAGRETKRS